MLVLSQFPRLQRPSSGLTWSGPGPAKASLIRVPKVSGRKEKSEKARCPLPAAGGDGFSCPLRKRCSRDDFPYASLLPVAPLPPGGPG